MMIHEAVNNNNGGEQGGKKRSKLRQVNLVFELRENTTKMHS